MNRVSVSSYYASILASGVPVLSLLVTMVTSCSKKGLCPQCLQGEEGGSNDSGPGRKVELNSHASARRPC